MQAHKSSPRGLSPSQLLSASVLAVNIVDFCHSVLTSLYYLEGDWKEILSRMFTVSWDSVGKSGITR